MKLISASVRLTALALTGLTPLSAQSTYGGREPNAPWRAAAAARIEQLRKGDFTLRVIDASGRPVAGATVDIAMQRHAFPFGSALQMARIVQDTPANRLYRQKAVALFNAASPENDLKWPPWIGEWGAGFGRTQTLAGLRWLSHRGYELRGHVLVWPGWTPPTTNLPNAITALRGTPRQSEIPQLVLDHIAEQTTATKDLINEWDVQNEPFDNKDLMELFGPQIQVDWFKAARASLPTAALYLNDYNIEDQTRNTAHVRVFEDTVRYLQQNGAPITGLGLQGHFGANPSSITDYLVTLERYAAFGLVMRITEFDINTTDLALQADYTRDFLTASFSHPAMAGFQFWGFWESAHWRPNAALYRADWSEKPNGAAYRALVFDQWWTRASGAANAQGEFRGRGFFGDYRATVTVGGRTFEQTFSLRAGAAAPTITLTTEAPRLANLATRAQAGGAAGPLAAGFVISGSGEKTVLLRGVGPALTGFGVPGALARPVLTLYRGGQPIAANTSWSTAANAPDIAAAAATAGAFALTPGSADSALLLRLAPGAYSAQITAADGGEGLALVEAYEVGAETGRFTNLSTRAFVGTGAAVAIPGLVVTGPSARTFLIRGVGPGLADFGVPGTLARPYILLVRGSTFIAANDRWETAADPAAIAAAGARMGAFALKPGNADAALLVTLEPGAYSVLIFGADGGTGDALVEIYEAP
ncbi:MAG: endo-1,4-beta-xylanase [Opitutaceae bacterium]|nr:endo-1,4-beta-xylanase [Opitutaceae bacterium]